MSTLTTLSTFYFGTTVTALNNKIAFSEGGPELIATIPIGDYSMTDYVKAWAKAMTLAGALDYTTAFNRTTRKMTITTTATFSLLSLTGTISGVAAWATGGWSILADKTGASTYTSDTGVGSEYRPQYLLSNYTSTDDFKVKESSVVNVASSGLTQTLQFGNGNRARMNIVLITNLTDLKQSVFYSNASGLANARTFLDYLITKAKVEFMPNVSDRSGFVALILEATKAAGRDGTAYELQNMKGAKDFYETGDLLFRKALA